MEKRKEIKIREVIISTLDMKPLSFRQLAQELGYTLGSDDYNDLLEAVSEMQRRKKYYAGLYEEPKIQVAVNRSLKPNGEAVYHPDSFVLFRTNQTGDLVKAGKISGPIEVNVNIRQTAKDYGFREFLMELGNRYELMD